MKFIKYILFSFLILGCLFKVLQNTGVLNNITIANSPQFSNNKTKVYYGNVSMNNSDSMNIALLSNSQKIYNGYFSTWIPYNYGENDFLITYDNTHYGIFRHFKFNWYESYTYDITIFEKDGIVKCIVTIKGKNGGKREIEIKKTTLLQQGL